MKFQELKKNLSAMLLNLFFIKGEDAFLRDKAVEMIVSRAVKLKELNALFYDDESTDMVAILNSCRALPMMDDHRVVVLRDILVKKSEDLQPLVDYIKNPTSTTILVVVASVNVGLYKKIEDQAVVVDCGYLDTAMLSKLVVTELAKRSVQIQQDALDALIEYCNHDYMRINNEIIKLANLINGGVVDLKVVQENVTKDVEYDIFELTNAVSEKNGKVAISIIKNLLLRKEPPQKLLIMMQNSFRRMFFAMSSKDTNEQVASLLNVKPYAVKKAREQGAKFGVAKLKKCMDLGAMLDFSVKNGKITDENALINYVSMICV